MRFGLLRRNPALARLWVAEVVSLAGDWFTFVALSVIASQRTGGSGAAVGWIFLAHLLPYAVLGPLLGMLADRFDRRRLMILCDLLRVATVLGLIVASAAGSLLPLYALVFLLFVLGAIWEPARSALTPSLVGTADLVGAATLTSVTWSVMAAAGGILAGVAVEFAGIEGAYLIDAATFAVAAAVVATIRVPGVPAAPPGDAPRESVRLAQVFHFLRAHPAIAAVTLAKVMNGIAVVDVFVVLYATRLFVLGRGGALSTGLLYTALGLGALVGPLLFSRFNDGTPRRMRRIIAAGGIAMPIGMLTLAAAPSFPIAALGVFLRALGGSTVWTMVAVTLQKTVPDRLRGRVFGVDLAAATLAAGLAIVLTGQAVDRYQALRSVAAATGIAGLALAAVWIAALKWMDAREAESAAS